MRAAALLAILIISAGIASADQCVLKRAAVIPFETTDENPTIFIEAAIADRKTSMLVDTGGFWSLIDRTIVDELKLPTRRVPSGLVDAAGKPLDRVARAHGLTLGGAKLDMDFDFLVAGLLGQESSPWGLTMGLNFFTAFDLEVDSAAKTIALFWPDHCKGAGVHWADEAVTLEIKPQDNGSITMPYVNAEIGGERVRALFDTGSTHTSMGWKLAYRKFGLTRNSPGVVLQGQARVGSGKLVDTYRYTFDALVISGVRFENVPVHLGDFEEFDLVLGMHEMRHLHLYFAFRDRMIHITAADAGRQSGGN